jgi:arylsulfatase A-like enzyme
MAQSAPQEGSPLAPPQTKSLEPATPPLPPKEAAGPNVLVVMWDTARADRMSLYGHNRPTTPRIDAFAREALVFDAAISPSFWTVPSHASLFTGLPTSVHRATSHSTWLPEHHTTLAEWFGEHGYDTYAFSTNPNLSNRTNLIQGFDLVESQRTERWRQAAIERTNDKLIARDKSSERSPAWVGKPSDSSKDGGELVERALVAWIDGRPDPDRPFFAFLNYMEVHGPRLPSMASRKAVLDPELLEAGLATPAGYDRISDANHRRADFTDAERTAMLGVYDAAMHELDAATGALFDTFAERGWLDDTVVVVVSDHGENFGEHGLYGHNYSLHDTLIHVPLVIRYPATIKPGRVTHPVTTRDLYGTLVRLAGLPMPKLAMPLGDVLTHPADAPVFSELLAFHGSKAGMDRVRPDGTHFRLRRKFHAVVLGDEKFIHASDGQHERFDRSADAAEQSNLWTETDARSTSLKAVHQAWRDTLPEPDRSIRPGERKKRKEAEGEVTADQLKALGYVE